MNDDVYLTAEEVRDLLQVTGRTLYRLIRNDGLPGYRVGRQWRFRKADVDAWLLANSRRLPNSTRRRVLVVDDEEPIRKFLTKALALVNYDVVTAPDAPTALTHIKSGRFDLLVTDLQMPGMGGLALIREARVMSPRLAVVIITGKSTEAVAIEAVNLGVGGYLTKPFRLHTVLVRCARAMGDPEPAAPPDSSLSPE